MEFLKKLRFLNSNTIKFIAAFFMLIDHIGVVFFPHVKIWRLLGRISMPIFAFTIAEGCKYTKNKIKHFAIIALLATFCQVVYYFFDDGNLHMSILVTFSLSILTIYSLHFAKKTIFDKESHLLIKILSVVLFFAMVGVDYALCQKFIIDYKFWGIMLPVFASLFDFSKTDAPEILKKFDCLPVKVLCLTIGLAFIYYPFDGIKPYAFISIPILLLYNGQKGKHKVKNFFYIFYPAHLALLQGLYMLINLF